MSENAHYTYGDGGVEVAGVFRDFADLSAAGKVSYILNKDIRGPDDTVVLYANGRSQFTLNKQQAGGSFFNIAPGNYLTVDVWAAHEEDDDEGWDRPAIISLAYNLDDPESREHLRGLVSEAQDLLSAYPED